MGIAVFPLSTGVTYALIPKTQADGMVLHSMGYGRTDASDGRIFGHVFTAPMTYWSQVTAITRYIGDQIGGMNNLKGKKIASFTTIVLMAKNQFQLWKHFLQNMVSSSSNILLIIQDLSRNLPGSKLGVKQNQTSPLFLVGA